MGQGDRVRVRGLQLDLAQYGGRESDHTTGGTGWLGVRGLNRNHERGSRSARSITVDGLSPIPIFQCLGFSRAVYLFYNVFVFYSQKLFIFKLKLISSIILLLFCFCCFYFSIFQVVFCFLCLALCIVVYMCCFNLSSFFFRWLSRRFVWIGTSSGLADHQVSVSGKYGRELLLPPRFVPN